METKKLTVKDIVDSLDYYELIKIKKDIQEGSFKMKDMVKRRLKEIEKEHMYCCATCSSEIDIDKKNNFTLIFGPYDFRKKASFCGKDCLLYFLNQTGDTK